MGGGGAGVREGDVMMETESGRLRRCYAAGFEDGGVGPQPGSPEASRGWEGKETDGLQPC